MFEEGLITVFRSVQRRECNERLLVLTAVGVDALVTAADGEFLLQVAPQDAGYAARHLLQYDAENRPPPPLPPPPPVYGHAWVGCAIYVLVLGRIIAEAVIAPQVIKERLERRKAGALLARALPWPTRWEESDELISSAMADVADPPPTSVS